MKQGFKFLWTILAGIMSIPFFLFIIVTAIIFRNDRYLLVFDIAENYFNELLDKE